MSRLRNKFSDLNEEKNTKLAILRLLFSIILTFLAISAVLGVGVFFATHGS